MLDSNAISKYNLLFFCFLFAITACRSDKKENHEAALPHNKLEHPDELSKRETEQLKQAKGKLSELVSVSDLEFILLEDTAAVTVLNFWKTDCGLCTDIQKKLEEIMFSEGKGKMNVISINMDAEADEDLVNLAIRSEGFIAPVYQLINNSNIHQLEIMATWDGQLPATAVIMEGELEVLYQQEFSKNELLAILLPYFL
ncbi:MAG TPA: hypothetical protein ENJ95_03855 [Bacteroidetes bacterium]|nr:hypothetical protein [Bacteroidota bacterium]